MKKEKLGGERREVKRIVSVIQFKQIASLLTIFFRQWTQQIISVIEILIKILMIPTFRRDKKDSSVWSKRKGEKGEKWNPLYSNAFNAANNFSPYYKISSGAKKWPWRVDNIQPGKVIPGVKRGGERREVKQLVF